MLFDQDEDDLIIDRADLSLPVTTANPYIRDVITQRIEQVIQVLDSNRAFSADVLGLIERGLRAS